MSRFSRFMEKAIKEQNNMTVNDDAFGRFMWRYGKWLMLGFIPMLWMSIIPTQHPLALKILLSIGFVFCAFFCFVDLYRLFKWLFNVKSKG